MKESTQKTNKDSSKTPFTTFLSYFYQNTQRFSEGAYLFQAGSALDNIYYLKRGVIKLQCFHGNEPVTFYLARQGDFLGFNDVFHNHETYTISASALLESQTGFITINQYIQIMRSNPALTIEILNRINQQINRIEKQSVFTYQKDARSKILGLASELIAEFGLNSKNFLNIPLSPEDLAGLSGISKTYMRKLLPIFRKEGLLRSSNNKLQILDPSKFIQQR